MFLFEQEGFRNTTSRNKIFTFNWVVLANNYCVQVTFRQGVIVNGNTWYSFSISTTISALCLNLLHHPWSNLIDPDIHPTAVTRIARCHWVLQTANNQLQIPYKYELFPSYTCTLYHEGKQPKFLYSCVLSHSIVACTMHLLYMKNTCIHNLAASPRTKRNLQNWMLSRVRVNLLLLLLLCLKNPIMILVNM